MTSDRNLKKQKTKKSKVYLLPPLILSYLSMKFLIIVGTSRDGRKTIHPARAIDGELRNRGHETTFYDLKEKDIPPLGNRTYRENEEPVPEDIQELSREVKDSDCIVIATPEYNHSIPGVLKNAMDYLYPEYDDKPFASVTVSGGGFGGVRALNHLHDIILEFGGWPGPNLAVSRVSQKFSDQGELQDEEFAEYIENFVEKVEGHTEKFSKIN